MIENRRIKNRKKRDEKWIKNVTKRDKKVMIRKTTGTPPKNNEPQKQTKNLQKTTLTKRQTTYLLNIDRLSTEKQLRTTKGLPELINKVTRNLPTEKRLKITKNY
ncbi:hypothetical protein C2G38_2188655 [Gigaspora rosea]|uniref:Uncharacterized protein n=1 Tax=Gigaspora rosea TaxID=44941 RepID=A0A397V7P8_9GLOM|nr:hypothetical protein C2G38_2188655 [Gigaspora rosea]